MPTTINGVGTHYYGKRNVLTRPGICSSCKRQVNLSSYDTRLWFVVLFIPVVPLARKRIIDSCPACRRHYVTNLQKWETTKQLEISGALEKYRNNPSAETAIDAHRQLTGFHQLEEAAGLQKLMCEQYPDNAKVFAYLAQSLTQYGRTTEADPMFARALELRPDKLDATMAGRPEDADALWDKARVFLELHQPEAATPLLRQVLAIDPHHAAANFNLGAFLLKSGDAEGEQFLERAVAEDEEALPRVANELHGHFRQSGQLERIRELYARMDRHEKSIVASREERTNVTAADTLVAHELTETELAALRAALAAEADVLAANLARKELKHFVKQKLYLLCVRVRPAWHRLPDADRQQAVIGRLTKAVRVPGRVLIFAGAGELRGVARKLRKAPGSLVYAKEKKG